LRSENKELLILDDNPKLLYQAEADRHRAEGLSRP
jgi:hypothetical protein